MGDSFTHRPPRRRYDSAFESEASGPSSAATPFKRQRSIKAEDDDDALFVWPDVTATSQSTGLPLPPPQAGLEAVELAEEQRTAIDIIRQGNNVFLTGSAGSGKTMVLNKAVRQLQDLSKRVRKTAPTGKAASNLEGTTLHNLFGLTPKKMQLPMDQLEKMVEQNDQLRLRLAEMDVLIIDEISMVENIFFSRINRLMQAAKENNEPFGGVQLIVCGDFRQLAPVKPFSYCFACGRTTTKDRDRERKVTIYRCTKCFNTEDEAEQWAFCSAAWEFAAFTNINLTLNHRQSEDRFVTVLKKLATGHTLNQTGRRLLYDHPCDVEDAVHLYPTNAEVDAMNNREFDKLQGTAIEYRCGDHFRWNPRDDQFRNFGARSSDGQTLEALWDHQYRPLLQLKKDQPVVLITNLDVEAGLVNGSQGIIAGFKTYNEACLPRPGGRLDHAQLENGLLPTEAEPHPINVRGGENAAYRQAQVKDFLATAHKEIHLPVVQFHNGKKITVFPDCSLVQLGDDWPYSLLSRTQMPLIAAWAMSVHKAQGMTMDKVVVNLSKMFCSGQAYVALSRARTLFGLKVEGSEKGLDGAGADPNVTRFMEEISWTVG